MKTDKPTLVLMAGLPGAGKTTLARSLGCELQWQVIDKDSYEEVLLLQGSDDDSAARAAYERSFHELHTALVQERSVIFDTAALRRFILDATMQIVRDAGNAQLKVILCVADRDLRNQRLRTRPDQITRIWVDPATYHEYLQHFEHLPQDRLLLCTNAPIEVCLAKAKKYVTS